ncbi:winged helix-turn-helix transcriptional regulator [Methylolobus aquaticus]|nr:winged helix-turn-helix transcriptional regulator [Methylolobus aquaticus]
MEGTGRDLSLARLAKRTGLRQSTLRRYLTLLEEAGIVRVTLEEDGGGSVGLLRL